MTAKPDVPKRLAARIRAAQHALKEALGYIAAADFNHRQNAPRLAEFDADPEAFASRHYTGHAVDSYPVRTNVSRLREKEDYSASRQEARKQRIKDRLRELQEVEDAILAEVLAMRPTSGRVPWPAPLPSVDEMMAAHRAEDERILEQARREGVIRQAELDEESRRMEEEIRAQQERDDEETRAMLADMTPSQRDEWRAAMGAIAEALRDGRVGPHNLGEFVKSGAWRKR